MEWESICANHLHDKELIFRILKGHLQLTGKNKQLRDEEIQVQCCMPLIPVTSEAETEPQAQNQP